MTRDRIVEAIWGLQPKNLPKGADKAIKRAVIALISMLFDEHSPSLVDPQSPPTYVQDAILAWGLLQRAGAVVEYERRKYSKSG